LESTVKQLFLNHNSAGIFVAEKQLSAYNPRVCLKIAFRQMYTAEWGVQMAEMNFQTRSSKQNKGKVE
jgi:hypothetical protein